MHLGFFLFLTKYMHLDFNGGQGEVLTGIKTTREKGQKKKRYILRKESVRSACPPIHADTGHKLLLLLFL